MNQTGIITTQDFTLTYSAISDTGLVRKHNEDLYLILEQEQIFCVADGAGGQGKGDLASYLTIKGINDVIKGDKDKSFDDTIPIGDDTIAVTTPTSLDVSLQTFPENGTILIPAIHHANDLCRSAGAPNSASTIVGCHFDGKKLHIVHVGDSRAYCLKDNQLYRITKDHSLVNYLFDKGEITEEEKQNHPKRNVILRAIGAEDTVKIDIQTRSTEHGSVYLLCSDGLTAMVSDKEIASHMKTIGDINVLCSSLVQAAKNNGGRDNITIILIKVQNA